MKYPNQLIAIVTALLSFLCFSIMDISNKFFLEKPSLTFPVYFMYIKILCVVFLISSGFVIYRKNFLKVKNKTYTIIRTIILVINTITTTLAVKYLSLDVFYGIVMLMPVLTCIFSAWMIKEQLLLKQIALMIIAFLGAIIVITPNLNSINSIIGVILAFITIISGSLSAILAKKYLSTENPVTSTFYALLGAMIIGIIMSYGDISVNKVFIPDIFAIICISISALSTLTAATLYFIAFQKAKPGSIAYTQYTQIIWGVLFGYIIFHDVLSISSICGILTITIASMYNTYLTTKTNFKN